MIPLATILAAAIALYALIALAFLILENRRPQSTLAWALIFIFLPGVGLLIYRLFGRNTNSFVKQRKLARQNLEGHAKAVLSPLLARQDAAIKGLEGGSLGRRKLMQLVRSNSYSALTAGNKVEILQNAATFYPRMMADIESAEHSIHLQYFIWQSDAFTEQLKDLLVKRAAAGIEVKLLYDALGSLGHLRRGYVKDLEAAGVRVAPTSSLWRLHTLSYRNHRKITVIDGRIGYTGGMNIGQEHLTGGKGFSGWRDTQLRIVGDGTTALQAVFAVDWYNAVQDDLFQTKYFPAVDAQIPVGNTPVQIVTSGPDSQWAAIEQVYFYMIVSAQRRVLLQSPFFILSSGIAEALRSAALSGVEVKVMVTARASGDPVPGWAGNTFMQDIVKAGVRVFLYDGGYLHAKTISIDSEICSIGSTNIDIRSFTLNYELNAVIYDHAIAEELEASFERDLASCTEFDPAEYGRRNVAARFRDSVARLFSPLQ